MIRLLLIKLSAIILPVALLVMTTNYLVDPANLFSPEKYVSGIADILSKGHNVDKISNYNERLLQEQMIERLPVPPDVVVLGSSRIMEIGPDFFPGKTVLNAGVSHANIHDLIAITGLLDSTGKLPKEVLINVDPGLISEQATIEWQSLYQYYNYFLAGQPGNLRSDKISNNSIIQKKLYSLVSFEYFKESALFFFKGKDKRFFDTGLQPPEHYGRFSNGTICYPQEYIHPDTFMVAKVAGATALEQGLSPSDTGNIALFYLLIDFLQKRKIKIGFIMVPFHPAYYAVINGHQQNIFSEYELLFRTIAAKKAIPVRGSFNALVMGVERRQFYDMYHCSKEAVKTAFNKVI